MSTVFKKIAITVFGLGIVIFSFSSCADDVILEPLDSLLGNYEGHYTLTDLGQDVTRIDIGINWVFRDFTYDLEDTSATICSPSGEYELHGSDIDLDELFEGNDGSVCDPSLNPLGNFSLRRPGDSLILTQSENDIFIEIRLKKVK